MSTPATVSINPNVYVKPFLAYAVENKLDVTTEHIMQWDTELNNGRMRHAIVAKYGTKVLIEIAVKELFKRYLYSGTLLRIEPSTNNPPGLKEGVKTFTGIQGKRYIPAMTTSEQDGLIAVQTEKFKEAGRRLKAYGLSLKKLHSLLDEL